MKTEINWNNVVGSLYRHPAILAKIQAVSKAPLADDPQTVIRALALTFAKDQPFGLDPLTAKWSNNEVFKAAVWAIGSNMRDWDKLLKKEVGLRTTLHNYDPSATHADVIAGKITVASLAKFFPGTTQSADARAVIKWADLLAAYPNYYQHIVTVARIFAGGLGGHHFLPAPYQLPELSICLACYFAGPPNKWPGRSLLPNTFLTTPKWPGMGCPLGIEFLRNLGWPGFKPDRHIMRLFDTWLPGHYDRNKPTSDVLRLANMIGSKKQDLLEFIHYAQLGITLSPPPDTMPLTFADNLLWMLGSEVETKKVTDADKGESGKKYLLHKQTNLTVPFAKTHVETLAGNKWDQWVNEILQDMTLWQLGDFEPLGKNRVWAQLSSLQSILMVPANCMRDARTVWGSGGCNEPDSSLDYEDWDKFEEDYDDDDFYENESCGEDGPYDRDYSREEAENPDASDRKASGSEHTLHPHGPDDTWDEWEEQEDVVRQNPCMDRDRATVIVIERYGIYTASLGDFVSSAHWQGTSTALYSNLAAYLKQNPEKTGPAIILCPELIQKIPSYIRKDIEKINSDRLLPDGCTATMFALRKVLLHELGHHLFSHLQHGDNAARVAFSESLANWFCYQMLSSWERDLLWAFTKHQAPVYSLYSGLVVLRQKDEFPDYTNRCIMSAYTGNSMPRLQHWFRLIHCHHQDPRKGIFAACYLLQHIG